MTHSEYILRTSHCMHLQRLVEGRIDQLRGSFSVSKCSHRTFTTASWQQLREQLGAWKVGADSLGLLRREMQAVPAAAQAECRVIKISQHCCIHQTNKNCLSALSVVNACSRCFLVSGIGAMWGHICLLKVHAGEMPTCCCLQNEIRRVQDTISQQRQSLGLGQEPPASYPVLQMD